MSTGTEGGAPRDGGAPGDGETSGGGTSGDGGAVAGEKAGADGADFSEEEASRGQALFRQVWPLALGASAASLALSLALGLTSAGTGLIGAFGDAWAARVAGGAVTLVLLPMLLGLPFAARGRVVRARFGLVTQGWGGWAVDRLRGLLISLPLAAGALFAVYALAGTTRWWWAWAALGAAALTVLMSFLAPLVFEPLFNRFTPMEAGPLRESLLALAARDGVVVRDVLVADASRRTTALNAYVSGFGRTRRIVAYDTLLTTAEPREVELVVAHELGHVVHRDVLRGTVLGAVGAAAGVCVLAAVVSWRALLDAAGVDRFADPGSAWLLAAVAGVGEVLSGPLWRAVSRRVERRADVHALDLTAAPAAFAAMQRRLTVVNVGHPDPPRLLHLLLSTHPAPAERIRLARAWRPPTTEAEHAPKDRPPA
ncbi:STE24 endopeptidase [Actinacidiphila rubida]|uniref:STE24 endopeptidase n=1 Tax=Actinacidiphila rubida TaxID=310780 RepID=A0A1H8IP10_9ACTN|nr:M48 family metallopeptidase [Actinacidiphila rubida]SEN70453.1 STE24 endopeptidase [Actinacidiphila rubida]